MAEYPGAIQSLSTENTEVARIVAAHNAVLAVLAGIQHLETPEAEATRYAALFGQILNAIKPAQRSASVAGSPKKSR